MSLVLTQYPLSLPFRKRFEDRFGPNQQYLLLSELRRLPLREMLAALRSMRPPMLSVVLEDPNSAALAPVLQVIAGFTRADELRVVDGQLRAARFGRGRSLTALAKVGKESAAAAFDVRAARLRIGELSMLPRVVVPIARGGLVAYLNCNLWFGVKAGGSVGHISGVANALMDAGYALDFYTVGDRLLVDERATLQMLDPPASLAFPFEATYYRFDRQITPLLLRRMAVKKPALLYQRLSLANFTGVELSRGLRLPLVLEYNGSEAWVAKNWGSELRFHNLAVDIERVALRHAHLVVTISEPLREELLTLGIPSERIVCYPNCIDPKVFNPARYSAAERAGTRHELSLGTSDTVVTFVGTFGQWHGAEKLAAAARKLVVEHRELVDRHRLRFLFVGDGLRMPEVRRELDFPESLRYVRLAGLVPQREAPKFLAASDILASPHVANADGTAFFGSPTKLFEYMAMGKAIVASDLDQIGAVLSPGIRIDQLSDSTGPLPVENARALLTRPGSSDDLARAIAVAAERSDWREQMGESARRAALQRYTWRHHVDAILSQLGNLGGECDKV